MGEPLLRKSLIRFGVQDQLGAVCPGLQIFVVANLRTYQLEPDFVKNIRKFCWQLCVVGKVRDGTDRNSSEDR